MVKNQIPDTYSEEQVISAGSSKSVEFTRLPKACIAAATAFSFYPAFSSRPLITLGLPIAFGQDIASGSAIILDLTSSTRPWQYQCLNPAYKM